MSDFSEIHIAELGFTITGKTPSSKNPEDFGVDYMFITPSDSFDNKTIYYTNRYLSREGLNKLKGKKLPAKSVLVSCIGSAMGKVTMNNSISVTNQQINSIIVNSKFDADYVYYCLKNNYKLLRNAASGSTALPMLNKTDFDKLKLVIHNNKSYQTQIAKVLSDLDAKIELNNKINAELEAMAKLIYDYWFVQFDFPFDFAQGKPKPDIKPYKSSGGKMVWNEDLKREVPVGWKHGTIKSWIGKDKSGDWGKASVEGNYIKRVSCIRGADINGLNGTGEVKAPTRFILEKNDHKILDKGDLVVEISGGSPTQSTGRLAFIIDKTLERFEDPLICSNFCKALTLKEPESLYNFVYLWNRLYDEGVLFGWEGKTSGIKNLLFDSFVSNYKVVLPPKDLMKKFHKNSHPIHSKIQKNLKENKKLAELRDWLLPMLMNGQVKVTSQEETLNMAAEPQAKYGKE